MRMLLTDFRAELRDRLLAILWRQWTAIGVSGRDASWTGSVIDPDALLLASCTMTRSDPRLFDAVLEWLGINGRFINIQRIKRMLKEEIFAGDQVLRAVAAAASTSVDKAKWASLVDSGPEGRGDEDPLFYLSSGDPLPVVREPDPLFAEHGLLRDRYEERGVAEVFRAEPPSNLLLRLRALLGVNARCEIFEYLLLNGHGSPRSMARDCYYFPATISKALAEMSQSGFLISRSEGRHRFYSLVPDTWRELLFAGAPRPQWVVWARLLSALEQIWLFLDRGDVGEKSVLAQASSLRRLLKTSVISRLDRSGLPFMFGDDSAHPGEEIIPFFIDRTNAALDWVIKPGRLP
jgi:hypothetical protein